MMTHHELAKHLRVSLSALSSQAEKLCGDGSRRRSYSPSEVETIETWYHDRLPRNGEVGAGEGARLLRVSGATFDRYRKEAQVTPRQHGVLTFYSPDMIDRIRAAQAARVYKKNPSGRRKTRAKDAPVPTAPPVPSDEEERIRRAVRLIGDGWDIELIKRALGFNRRVIHTATQRLQGVLF